MEKFDSNQGMGRVNLLESVPLQGENKMKMMTVNKKLIGDKERDVSKVFMDILDTSEVILIPWLLFIYHYTISVIPIINDYLPNLDTFHQSC